MTVSRYFVYKTTNRVNGKFYIGVHNGSDPHYLGSGTILKRAFNVHGRDNFSREILHEGLTRDEAYKIESQLVTMDQVNDPNCYNLKEGGCGGTQPDHILKKMSDVKKKMYQKPEDHPRFGMKNSDETRRKISEGNKGKKMPKEAFEGHRKRFTGNKLRSIPVSIAGTIYPDKVEAAKELGVSMKTIARWFQPGNKYQRSDCITLRGDRHHC